MDSLTQIVLGASVAEATLGKKIGNKAPLWGAIAGTIPDLDVVGRFFLATVDELHFHRGFTHGFIFSFLFAPILAWTISKIHHKEHVTFKEWTLMAFLGLVTHPILDCFTTWGTQLFWPHPYRVAWHSIFVLDPVYTIPFMTLLLLAIFKRKNNPARFKLNMYGLLISTLFLGVTLINKSVMKTRFEQSARNQKIKIKNIEVRPAPLQNILWTANIATDSGYYIGYKSFFDTQPPILDKFFYYPSNKTLLTPYQDNKELQRLLFITKGWYTVEKKSTTEYLINDLRFGLIDGIEKQGSQFVFAYKMSIDNESLSFEPIQYKFGKDTDALDILWHRIWGI